MSRQRIQPAPEAPADEDLRALAVDMARRAARAHREATAFFDAVTRRVSEAQARIEAAVPDARVAYEMARDWDTFKDLAAAEAVQAERRLIRVVAAMAGPWKVGGYARAEMVASPPRAMILDGELFVIFPDPSGNVPEGERREDGWSAMLLVEMALSSVARAGDLAGKGGVS